MGATTETTRTGYAKGGTSWPSPPKGDLLSPSGEAGEAMPLAERTAARLSAVRGALTSKEAHAAAKVGLDIGAALAVLGTNAYTVATGAASAAAHGGLPALAYTALGLGVAYAVHQGVDISTHRQEVPYWLGLGAAAALAFSGIGVIVGSPEGAIAWASISAGLMLGKGIAKLKLETPEGA